MGNLYLATGELEPASQYLHDGLKAAQGLDHIALAAHLLNTLGNLSSAQGAYEEALDYYRASLPLAIQAETPMVAARALINAAQAALHLDQEAQAKSHLEQARQQLRGLPASHDKAESLLSLGQTYNTLRSHLPEARQVLLVQAAEVFNEAAQVATASGDVRLLSYAWGYLGQLYEVDRRYGEALQLTRRAALAAQRVRAPESSYRWQWQTGRLLRVMGDLAAAVEAYRHAADTLQTFRTEIGPVYGGERRSFREVAERVHLELVDVLLQRAAGLTDPKQVEPYLWEARDVVEVLKAAELEDYFQDDCVARASTAGLDVVSQTAMIIYTIILPDRLELLVSLQDGLKRFSVPVDAATLNGAVRSFRRYLQKRTMQRYLRPARRLYDWLIRPLQAELEATDIDTLVFVPDGALRTIPMAALHDGNRFLIEKYAVAVTPGLKLTDPRPLPRQDIKLLALGLTKAVQGFAALPYVTTELMAIEDLYQSEPLRDEAFLASRVKEKLQGEPFSIVHIASHGQFRGNVHDTFVLTFDDKLTLNELDDLIGLLRFRDEPLELLTLSACQTAVGDDRAALGLAGIAVKAGARSALATLWYINDQASSLLVSTFYRHLQDPSQSRASALQQAQLSLLKEQRYRHPAYWAPFLLINNWL
ncbi:hypothetical protein C2W62_16555 [Candidatus Entotheonella serta]|nr:hypothetical protein C2W62_16555 [Candidatus Entotheonella serta]